MKKSISVLRTGAEMALLVAQVPCDSEREDGEIVETKRSYGFPTSVGGILFTYIQYAII